MKGYVLAVLLQIRCADRSAKIIRSETKRYRTTIHYIISTPHATALQFAIKANGRKSQYWV